MESLVSSRTGRQFQRYYNGCRQVVGCIPYRYKISNQSHLLQGSLIENLEVLLISSPKAHHLFFPKGGWEIDETMEEAALRETKEEAGVVGILENQLGKWSFQSKSQGTFHDAYMFPLLVEEQLDVWPEKNARRRIWMRVKEAREICSHSWMKEALDVFVCRLRQGMRQKEEESRTTCALEFLRTEQQRIGIVPQNGDEEADCYLVRIQEQIQKGRLKFPAKTEKAMGIDIDPFPDIRETAANVGTLDFLAQKVEKNVSLKELDEVSVQMHVAG
ncbi:unnamed protein product [Camellia sinensis]